MKIQGTFGGFSVNNLKEAKRFYGGTLGFGLRDEVGGVRITLPGGATVWMYEKSDHQPATYTTLNLVVENIDQAVDELVHSGIALERYAGAPQDDKGVLRGKDRAMGPNIAWFKDPAGNILALIED